MPLPTRHHPSGAPSGRRGALCRIAQGVGALALAPSVIQAQGPAANAAKMVWPSAIPLLDGTSWAVPSPAQPSAVILVFWSTTCPFCARHNPHVQKLHAASAGKGLRVLTAATDERPDDVRAYLLRHGYQFPVARDHDALRRLVTTRRVIPLTVAIDREARIREVIPGEMFEEDVLGLLKVYG
jgi:thiol-disulfide isomerase/thioredoxin